MYTDVSEYYTRVNAKLLVSKSSANGKWLERENLSDRFLTPFSFFKSLDIILQNADVARQ